MAFGGLVAARKEWFIEAKSRIILLSIKDLLEPVFIGLKAKKYLEKVTTQRPFPFRGKVGMGARTMLALFLHLPPP